MAPCPVYVAHTLPRVVSEESLELQPQRLGFDPSPPSLELPEGAPPLPQGYKDTARGWHPCPEPAAFTPGKPWPVMN